MLVEYGRIGAGFLKVRAIPLYVPYWRRIEDHRRCPGLLFVAFDIGKMPLWKAATHGPVQKHFTGVKVFEERNKSSNRRSNPARSFSVGFCWTCLSRHLPIKWHERFLTSCLCFIVGLQHQCDLDLTNYDFRRPSSNAQLARYDLAMPFHLEQLSFLVLSIYR